VSCPSPCAALESETHNKQKEQWLKSLLEKAVTNDALALEATRGDSSAKLKSFWERHNI